MLVVSDAWLFLDLYTLSIHTCMEQRLSNHVMFGLTVAEIYIQYHLEIVVIKSGTIPKVTFDFAILFISMTPIPVV